MDETSKANEKTFDQRMTTLLRGLQPPAGGLESMLAAMNQSAMAPAPAPRPSPVRTSPVWTRRKWLGVAAAGVAGLAVPLVNRKNRAFDQGAGAAEPNTFTADAAHKAAGFITLATKDASWSRLQAAQQEKDIPFSLLALEKLSHLAAKGCQGYDWRNHRVGLTCFLLPQGGLAHIFSISRQAFQLDPPVGDVVSPSSVILAGNQREHFTWTEKDSHHVMVAAKPGISLTEIRNALIG